MVYEILKQGKENALSQEYLKTVLGFNDKRELRKQIETERREGKVILSSMGEPGGYYQPKNAAEVREYIRTFERRAKGTLYTLKGARRYLEEMEGQCKLGLDNEQEEDNTV